MSKDHTDTVIDEQCAIGGEFEDASFCKGPSDGCEFDQRSARGYCPGEPGHLEEVCGIHEHANEEHFLCDHEVDRSAPPYTSEETTTETAEPKPPVETLPETGIADFSGLALVGATLIAMGSMILRRT